MKLKPPCPAIDFTSHSIEEQQVSLSELRGKPLILSFFRDAACPFCNMRVFEYTKKFEEWDELGIVVIAVFSSSNNQIREFVTQHPRPFITIGDPQLSIYNKYGIEESANGLLKALLFRFPRIINGFRLGAKADPKKPNGKLIPADFLISPSGKIVDLWYGGNASDHMPMKRIERFVSKVRVLRDKQAAKRALRIARNSQTSVHSDVNPMTITEPSLTTFESAVEDANTKTRGKRRQAVLHVKPS